MQYQSPGKYHGINRDFADTGLVRYPGIADLLTHPVRFAATPLKRGFLPCPATFLTVLGRGFGENSPLSRGDTGVCLL